MATKTTKTGTYTSPIKNGVYQYGVATSANPPIQPGSYQVPNTYGLFTYTAPTSTNKTTSTPKKELNLLGYDEGALASSLYGNYSSSYSGGATLGDYISNLPSILAAYDNQAATDRANAQSTYNTATRNANQTYETSASSLLTSLKRFQEENAKNVDNQKRAYLANQASMDSARAEADRQTRINAAARGLGGSGLQQLAQLQNLISQGQDISNLATSNQNAMDSLRQALTRYEEDYTSNLGKATTARDNALADALTAYNNANNSISSKLATNYANAIANDDAARNDWEYKRAQLAATRASNNASANAQASSDAKIMVGLAQTTQNNLQNALKNLNRKDWKTYAKANGLTTKSQDAAKQAAYNAAYNSIGEILSNYGNNSVTDAAYKNLQSLLNYYK